jgi:hypothetical protein
MRNFDDSDLGLDPAEELDRPALWPSEPQAVQFGTESSVLKELTTDEAARWIACFFGQDKPLPVDQIPVSDYRPDPNWSGDSRLRFVELGNPLLDPASYENPSALDEFLRTLLLSASVADLFPKGLVKSPMLADSWSEWDKRTAAAVEDEECWKRFEVSGVESLYVRCG